MTNVRVISDVPEDKLKQVVTDLEYEVGKDNIRPSLQPNGLWKVEYIVEEPQQSISGKRFFAKSGS